MRPLKRSTIPLVCGVLGLGQSVFDAQGLAELLELVLTAGLTVPGAKQPVGGLLAIIASLKLRLRLVFGQQLGDLDRAGLGERLEEGTGRGGALVGVDSDVYPGVARSMATNR